MNTTAAEIVLAINAVWWLLVLISSQVSKWWRTRKPKQ